MKHILTFTTVLLLTLTAHAQPDSLGAEVTTDLATDISSLEISGGYHELDLVPLNAFLVPTYGVEFGPLNRVGIELSGSTLLTRRIAMNGVFGFHYVLPQKQSFMGNDLQLSGYHFYSTILGFDALNKAPNADLNLNLGILLGRYKLLVNDDVKYSNVVFAPNARIQPKFLIKKVVVAPYAEYQIDVSKDVWKVKKGQDVALELPGSTFTGLTVGVNIGFGESE